MTIYCHFSVSDVPQTRTCDGSVYDTASNTACWAGCGPVIGHAKMTRLLSGKVERHGSESEKDTKNIEYEIKTD